MAAYESSKRRELPTVDRTISSLRNKTTQSARCELDSHADTCALGINFIPLHFTGRVCDVTPYNADTYEPERNIPIISGATAWTCQESGQTFILVVNEGLWFGSKLQSTLLNPNQLRYSGVTVADSPFNPAEPLSIVHEDLAIPLSLQGTTIFMTTMTPTQLELDTCPHIHLTCDSEWNPQTVRLAATQSVEAEHTSDIEMEPGLAQISSVFCSQGMAEAINGQRYLKSMHVDVPAARTFVSSKRHSQVTSENLSDRWNIGLQQAR